MTPRTYWGLWILWGVLFLGAEFLVIQYAVLAALRAYVAGQ